MVAKDGIEPSTLFRHTIQSFFNFWLYWNTDRFSLKKKDLGHRETEHPQIMSEEHKMTKEDKLVLTITLAAIFFGIFFLGLIGVIFNLSS